MLEDQLWSDGEPASRSANKHVQRLRGKLEDNPDNPQWIASVYGVGYRFVGSKPRWQEPFLGN